MKSRSRGFTLVELIIAVGIVGVLAAVLLAVLNPNAQFKKARDAQRKNDLTKIQKALELYYQDNGAYPTTGGAWYSSEPDDNGCCLAPGGVWIPDLAPTYIKQLPKDPIGGTPELTAGGCNLYWKRAYYYRSDGSEYALLSHCGMENFSELNNPKSPFYDPQRPGWGLKICEGSNGCSW